MKIKFLNRKDWPEINRNIIVFVGGTIIIAIMTAGVRLQSQVNKNTYFREDCEIQLKEQFETFEYKLEKFDDKIDTISLKQVEQKVMLKAQDEKLDLILDLQRNR